jgi:fumarylacetoacetate (FAA) hydrolase family protein
VLIISSTGQIQGATLGNDFHLRHVKARSALLLGKGPASLGSRINIQHFKEFEDMVWTA